MGGGPTFDQWRFTQANRTAAAARYMPGLDQAAADRMLEMGTDEHAYEQAMLNYDVANPSSSTLVGRDILSGAQSAETARRALLERRQAEQEQASVETALRRREDEYARRYQAARQPKPKKRPRYTKWGLYEEPEEPDVERR